MVLHDTRSSAALPGPGDAVLSVPCLFAEQVRRQPTAPAVTWGERTLTYADLDAEANRVAHQLLRRGVLPEHRVGLLTVRSTQTVVAELAILKAGGAYVPVDVRAPRERMRLVLAEASASVLITDPTWLPVAEEIHAGPIVVLDDRVAPTGPTTDPGVRPHPDQLANVMFTSGSTGVPKGVAVRHRDVVALATDPRFRTGAHHRVLLHSPAAFDATTYELWVPLLGGGHVVLPQQEDVDADVLRELVADHALTALWLTAGLFRVVAEDAPESFTGLREVWTGGDVVPATAVRRVMAACPGVVVVNGYGPTETTTFATCHPMSDSDQVPDVIPIGRPLEDVRLHVLGADLRPVSDGEPGELFIAGAGVARGYLGRPGMTAERFVADPTEPGSRMYGTGDLVRWNVAGDVEFLGRADDQVKVRGFRIEPAEVEAAVVAHPAIAHAAVVAWDNAAGGRQLAAYVVAVAGSQMPAARELRSALERQLPAYMVPSAFVPLDALPLDRNGKLDRRALPAPVQDAESGGTAPRTDTERELTRIWADVLGLDRVGAEDRFVDLGGDSISSIRVLSRVRAAFGVRLSARDLFDAGTVAGMARLLPDPAPGAHDDRMPPAHRGAVVPMSLAQRRLWFLADFAPGGTEYYTGVGVRLSGPLDLAALENAFAALVARHESLRTTFAEVDGDGVQVIHETGELSVHVTDLSHLPDNDRPSALATALHSEATTPFSLEHGPLARALLVRLAEDEHVLVISQHHIVTDGWSIRLLVDELVERYAAGQHQDTASGDRPADHAEHGRRVDYADYAVWQRRQLTDAALAEQLEHWRRRLADIVPLELPTDRPRPPVHTSAGAVHRRPLPPEVVDRLTLLGQRHGATLFMTLTAAVKILLAKYANQRDIALGAVTSGRGHHDVETMLGFFVNTLVLRSDVDPALSFSDFLAAVRETTLTAFAHDDVPFDRVVDAVRPERDPSRAPLVQSVVVLQQAMVAPRTVRGLRVTEHDLPRPSARFDLLVEFWPRDGSLTAALEYNTDLFDEATVAGMAEHLEALLTAIVEDPDRRVGDFSLLSEGERCRLVADACGTTHDLPDRTLPELFAEQVARTPTAVAVSCDGTALAYAELAARANTLACRLVALGVGVDQPVGVLVARSIDLVVAEVAVVTAGAAYLPLDHRLPADRMRALLADAGASVLLVDESSERLGHQVHAGPCVVVRTGSEPAEEPAPAPGVAPRPDNLAYVMFTSGSTGVPKGVAVRHRDVVALAFGHGFRTGAHERVLFHSPAAFDASTYELWVPLLGGGQVVVAPPGDVDAEVVRCVVVEHGVTALWLTAGLFRLVAEESPDCLAGAREVWTGGEQVSPDAVRRVLAACPGLVVVDGYGPTETTTFATQHRMAAPEDVPDLVPIGRALDNMRVIVLDAALRPAPFGVPGELYIAGAGLARGYLNRPGLTAERFVPDPFGRPGERMYRTGDLVRPNRAGALEFLGRCDDQVKVRGFRIEPGEVEAALARHEDVAHAVVVVRGDARSRHLVAFVVPAPAATVDTAALRGFAERVLPGYMVPSRIVPLAELPLNRNGKVDRRALPELAAEIPRVHRAPRTDVERTLAGIWADVLRVPRVGLDDNFFALGGDSILSIQLVSRARRAGLALTSKDVFVHQTIGQLALRVAPDATAAGRTTDHGAVSGAVPLTPIQRWFFETQTVDPEHFAQMVTVRLAAEVDHDALRTALAAVVTHHDALRMRFEHDPGGGCRQHNTAVAPVEVLRPEHTGFDLAQGPLVAAVPVGDRALRLVVHHLVVDGVSWRILLDDLDRAYRQVVSGAPVDLGPRTTSFKEWAERLTRHARSGGFAGELGYWADVLAGHDAGLPTDRAGANTVAATHSVTVRLDARETAALLHDVPGVYRTQVNDVLLAALGRALGRWAGRDRVLVDLEGHGREELFADVDLSRTVGWFTTLFPVELPVPDTDWGTALKAVKEQLRSVPNRGIGYGALRYLTEAGTTAHAPDPAISFNYLGQFDAQATSDGPFEGVPGALELDASPDAPRPHLLDVVSRVAAGRLEVTWSYSEHRHHRATVERVAEDMCAALREIVAHCARPEAGGRTPSDFPLAKLDQATVDRIAGDGRSVADIYPLTPMQAGMVFHGLSQGDQGVYLEQIAFVLDGVPEQAVLGRAWQEVVDRTPVLRTHVVWEGLDEPLQVVRTRPVVPVTHLDWRRLSEVDRESELARLLETDRRAGLDPTANPLMRVAIARLPGDAVQVLWTFHHLLLDGWSVVHVLADVFAVHAGTTPPGRPPFRSYLEWLAAQDDRLAEEHWRRVLADLTEPTPLPTDRPRTGAHTTRSSAHVATELTESASHELRNAAARHGLTVNTLVQGAWALVLSRGSGQRDVCFGATVSGRPAALADVEQVVGVFINTVPVRVNVADDAPVGEWLRGLQEAQAESRRFEHVPLTRLRSWSGVPARANLFDSILVFENYPVNDRSAAAHGLRLRDLRAVETTNYSLAVVVAPAERMAIEFGYDPALFDAATVRRLAEQLRTVLEEIAAGPQRRVRDLSTWPADERERILGSWNDTAHPVPAGTVPSLFAEQVLRTPDAPAVVADGATMSYAQLSARAAALAHRLVAAEVRAEQPVGVLVDRSVELVVAELAVLMAGGAYLPLDTRAPADRNRAALTRAGASVLLTDRTWAATAGAVHVGETIVVTTDEPVDDAAPPDVPVHADNLAYVMYTSGSTGTPKDVAVAHRDVVALAFDRSFPGGVHDRVLLHSPQAFDASTYELWVPLLNGGQVVVAPPGDVDTDVLRRVVRDHGVTGLWLTAGLFRLVAADRPDCLRGVREVWTGGDVVPAEAVRRVLAACPALDIVNGYGPTETTTFATRHRMPAGEPVPDSVPIGRPLDNMRVHVVDADLRPVPVGAPGELCIAGAGVARGYLNQPGATAARFVADPFGPPGSRLYRSGDVVRWRADGVVEFVGRIDDQVKIRGFRVEPGEVEAVLGAHPRVAAAVVTVHADRPDRKRLVAYVVAAPGTAVDAAALRAFAGGALPDYMVPSVVLLDALPLSPNGKVDRRALPVPDLDSVDETGYREPRTDAERVLAEIWADVLGVARVGVEDDFFERGGDSIVAIRVASRARQAGLDLMPRDLFERSTIAELAALRTAVGASGKDGRGPVTDVIPLLPAQHRVLATPAGRPHGRDGVDSVVVEFGEAVDEGALRTALAAVVARHDALRLRWTQAGGRWCQRVAPAGVRQPDGTVEDLADGLALAAVPAPDHRSVRLSAHRLMLDRTSWRILFDDLDRAYGQAVHGRAVDLGHPATSLAAWSAGLSEHARAGGFDDELTHWRATLTGAGRTRTAEVRGGPARPTRSLDLWLTADQTEALLREVPEVYRTRTEDVLLAALGRALTRWIGRGEVLLDLERPGRETALADLDPSGTVGPLTTVFPVALDVPEQDWGATLRSVKEQVRAVPGGGLGYDALRHLAGVPALTDTPPPEVAFAYLGRLDHTTALGWHVGDPEPGAEQDHPLRVVAGVDHDVLRMTWHFSPEAYDTDRVRALAEETLTNLGALVEHCAQPGAGGRTPSDFQLAGLDQATLDALAGDGRSVEDIYPATPMQTGMIFHGLSQEGRGVYHEQLTFVLSGVAAPELLGAAWQRVVDTTSVLRTALVWHGVTAPLQVVHRDVTLPVTHLDWSELSEAERREALASLLDRDRAAGLDLTAAPLTRVAIARLSATEVRVVWTFHHALLDGWSVLHVLSDVFAAHEALTEGDGTGPAKRPPFRDYLTWLARQDTEDAQRHWRAVLAGFDTPTPLPYDRAPAADHRPHSDDRVTVRLAEREYERLRSATRRHGLTMSTVLHGAWALLLSRYSGRDDVCFGMTVSGRPADLPGADEITGMLLNTLPARIAVDRTAPVADWLRRCQSALAESRRFDFLPLSRIRACGDVVADAELFDSIVVVQNYASDEDAGEANGLAWRDLRGIGRTNYPLSVVASPGRGLTIDLGYDPGLFDEATVQRIAAHLLRVLDLVAADPGAELGRIDPMSERERRLVLRAWNDTACPVPELTVPELFARQVTRAPGATAVRSDVGTMTYAELDERSNRLAGLLARLGVAVERPVGLLMERSADVVVAELAILKAGGAYLRAAGRAGAAGAAAHGRGGLRHRGAGHRPVVAAGRSRRPQWSGRGGGRPGGVAGARRFADRRGAPGQPRLRDAHFGLYRCAQGRRSATPGRGRARPRPELPGRRSRPCPAALAAGLRRVHLRGVDAAAHRRPGGGRAAGRHRRRAAAQGDPGARCDGGVPHDRTVPRGRPGTARRVRGGSRGVDRWGGRPRRRAAPGAHRLPGADRGRRVRPDRDHHLRHLVPDDRRRRGARRGADRPAPGQHQGLRAGRRAAAGAAGGGGRVVHRRSRARPGIRHRRGADRGPVRREPVRDGGGADVPDRGPRALATGRRARDPGPDRRPGEGPRVPDRARRDRGPHRGGPRGPRGGGARQGGRAGPQAPGGLPGARRRGGRSGRRAARRAGAVRPRLHGALGIRRARRAAADRQWEARPPRPARAGRGHSRDRVHGA
ncbi:amino acid adenylation domain-containing protein [Kribbella qitaiheensis]|uniref:Amino acid adenylation domain-containing protein n=1 Tax=Kribbella qitaiheensis TaxID=1544730 RepID=A0A7G6WSQ1_9ACTN|nr:non-ribosomal peptide synthetase [Kribbella qitaiheensis]QNE17016.1 amino acid adenylation domain-containing protein [Kribbella qitaiheensis]